MKVHVVQWEGEVLGFLVPIFAMGNSIGSPMVKCFPFVCANVSLKSSIRGLFGDIFNFQIKVRVYEILAKSNDCSAKT